MTGCQEISGMIKLTGEQEKEGYWVEQRGDRVLVWHHNGQIGLLYASPEIDRKVQEVVERRRKQLKDIEEKTGWKANQ